MLAKKTDKGDLENKRGIFINFRRKQITHFCYRYRLLSYSYE